jgi:hypothetical protein
MTIIIVIKWVEFFIEMPPNFSVTLHKFGKKSIKILNGINSRAARGKDFQRLGML